MVEKPLKKVGTIPNKPPKSDSHIVRPVKYIGNISLFLGLISLFASFLGLLGSISRVLGWGISIPGAIPVTIMGAFLALMSIIASLMQGKTGHTMASKIGMLIGVFSLIFAVVSAATIPLPSASPVNPENPSNPGDTGTGLCYSNPDCDGFGSRHCENGAICSNDNLCHCIFASCKGNACAPESCSEGCDANSYCDSQNGVCVFNRAGQTND